MNNRSFLAVAALLGLAMVLGATAPAAAATSLRDDAMPTWVGALIIGAVVGLPVLIGLGIYFTGRVDPASLPASGVPRARPTRWRASSSESGTSGSSTTTTTTAPPDRARTRVRPAAAPGSGSDRW